MPNHMETKLETGWDFKGGSFPDRPVGLRWVKTDNRGEIHQKNTYPWYQAALAGIHGMIWEEE
jgi:hypothetical protein